MEGYYPQGQEEEYPYDMPTDDYPEAGDEYGMQQDAAYGNMDPTTGPSEAYNMEMSSAEESPGDGTTDEFSDTGEYDGAGGPGISDMYSSDMYSSDESELFAGSKDVMGKDGMAESLGWIEMCFGVLAISIISTGIGLAAFNL